MNQLSQFNLKSDFNLSECQLLVFAPAMQVLLEVCAEVRSESLVSTNRDIVTVANHLQNVIGALQQQEKNMGRIYTLFCSDMMIALEYGIVFGDQRRAVSRKELWVHMMLNVIPYVYNEMRGKYSLLFYDDTKVIYNYYASRQELFKQWGAEFGVYVS